MPEVMKLLFSRKEAARSLSISIRKLDQLIASGELNTRRIGTRVQIPSGEMRRFASVDHPNPINPKKP